MVKKVYPSFFLKKKTVFIATFVVGMDLPYSRF